MSKRNQRIITLYTIVLLLLVSLGISHVWYLESSSPRLEDINFTQLLEATSISPQRLTMKSLVDRAKTQELYGPDPTGRAFRAIPLDLIRLANKYDISCSKKDYELARQLARQHSLSPMKLLAWHKARCTKNFELFRPWARRAPLLHPSGMSYGQLILKYFKNQAHALAPFQELLHLREKETLSPFDNWFSRLSSKEQSQFLMDKTLIITKNEFVIKKVLEKGLIEARIYPLALVHNEVGKTYNYNLVNVNQAQTCSLYKPGYCFIKKDGFHLFWTLRKWRELIYAYVAVFFLFLFLGLWLTRRLKERQFIAEQAQLFQVISHEARTPLTAVTLSAGKIRKSFDRLDEAGQKSVLTLLESSMELEQVITKSLNEIQKQEKVQPFDINAASRELILRKFEGLVHYQLAETALYAFISAFWYQVCLSNLIRNALKHGQGNVQVRITDEGKVIAVEVSDDGQINLKTLKSLTRAFQKRDQSNGLGLGLSIVQQRLESSGGELVILSQPTRFIMKLKKYRKR